MTLIPLAPPPGAGGFRARALDAAYARARATLIPRFDHLDSAALLWPLRAALCRRRLRIADIGAGTGRDAAWLTRTGHRVTAVEPVTALCAHPHLAWSPARLPHLHGVRGPFDLVLISAVWHHLPTADRAPALRRLRGLLGPGGQIWISLRDGPTAPDRPGYGVDPMRLRRQAIGAGLRITDLMPARAQQASGARWRWAVLRTAREF
ncbi:class I SAM-dependent methyltransferase [Sulfitobacter albidus]|uniref:Class I SAM-dependent methyltransferase n=1 Tax=Sulfitobacter albidus TaxID=2829501 RepID=A0A975JCD7_9RHOB|nr:class I SAM-dependent methyltransferase [Sulfitobacter albidus]QUJ75892.1 class I SAM-dependent methyltransferase [Sulfitobacter albidus]